VIFCTGCEANFSSNSFRRYPFMPKSSGWSPLTDASSLDTTSPLVNFVYNSVPVSGVQPWI
jgi:hypothetical protein